MPSYPPRLLLVAVGVVSAAALGYEVLLIRSLSIIQWHPVASVLMSLTLVGYAASGTALSVFQLSGAGPFGAAFTVNAVLFGLSAVVCFLAAQAAVFNPYDLFADLREWLHLFLVALLLALPFFFAANCVALALQRYSAVLGRIYGVSLIGAGLGAVVIIAALFVASPGQALCAIAGLGALAGLLGYLATGRQPRWVTTVSVAATVILMVLVQAVDLEPRPSEYKALPRLLGVVGAREIALRNSPLGLLQVVETPQIPLRHAPGLSQFSRASVPDQLAVFTDGDYMHVVDRFNGELASAAYLDDVPSALSYHLLAPRPSVLILGAAGGTAVLQALAHQASRVDAVELNPQLAALVRDDFGDFSGHLYDDPRVVLHFADARGFVRGSDNRWGLIQLNLTDGFGGSVGGFSGTSETFAYTIEALVDYLNHLEPGGLVAITGLVRLPPRDGVKLFATALASLESLGVTDPGRRLAWIRNWQVSSLVIKNGDFSADELERIRQFDRRRAFDEAYLYDIKAGQDTTYHVLSRPYFSESARALLSPLRHEFLRTYKFRVDPATDDRPYFFDFFRWPLLREAWILKGVGGPSLADLGYPLLVGALIQALVLGGLFLLIPLGMLRRQQPANAANGRIVRTVAYFSLTGVGFMFTEIVYMQKFTLYLAHPLYAIPLVLAGFLVFAGTGSRLAARIPRRSARGRVVLAVTGFALLSVVYWHVSPTLLGSTLGLPIAPKLMLVLGMIAPLAVCMGFLFPLGMMRLTYEGAALVPWAFGINGCAAAIATVLATLLAMHLGQTAVLLLAVALYAIAALSVP